MLLALMLLVAALASPAGATSVLHLRSTATDFLGGGLVRTVTADEATFTATAGTGIVHVHVDAHHPGTWWDVWLGGPNREPLVAKEYPVARDHQGYILPTGHISVSGEGRACANGTGRFTVREIELDENDPERVRTFAADFEFHCYGDRDSALYGSIRVASGDATCDLQPDGLACDDQNPCTTGDVCHANRCIGVGAACDDGDACTFLDACDPADGVCRGTDPFDCSDGNPCDGDEICDPTAGTCEEGLPVTCDDGDPCDGIETCNGSDGSCNAGAPLDCGDGSVCTADLCETGVGCVHPSLGSCWTFDARTRVTVCLDGRCASDGGRGGGVLLLADDGTYLIPSAGTCNVFGVEVPDEVGTWREQGRGLVLDIGNLPAVVDATNRCNTDGVRLRIRRYRQRLRVSPDGLSFKGKVQSGGTARYRGRTLSVVSRTRWRGRLTPGAAGAALVTPAALVERMLANPSAYARRE